MTDPPTRPTRFCRSYKGIRAADAQPRKTLAAAGSARRAPVKDHDWTKSPCITSDALKDCLQQLCLPSQTDRINSLDKLKAHAWFAGFSWNAVIDGTMPAPITPNEGREHATQTVAADVDHAIAN